MDILEITIDGETYVSMDTDYFGLVETSILEANLYGKTKFLKKEFFHHFTENGPQPVSRETIQQILIQHKDT